MVSGEGYCLALVKTRPLIYEHNRMSLFLRDSYVSVSLLSKPLKAIYQESLVCFVVANASLRAASRLFRNPSWPVIILDAVSGYQAADVLHLHPT